MAYEYDKFLSLIGEDPPNINMMKTHDQNVGIFMRLFSTGELHMKMIICILIEIDPIRGMFLLSKMSAGQTAALFRDTIRSKTTDELSSHGVRIANKYLSLNEFRNELAHTNHFFAGSQAFLAKQGMDFNWMFNKLNDVSADKFAAKIEEIMDFLYNINAVYAKALGSPKTIDDLVATSKKGGSVFEGMSKDPQHI